MIFFENKLIFHLFLFCSLFLWFELHCTAAAGGAIHDGPQLPLPDIPAGRFALPGSREDRLLPCSPPIRYTQGKQTKRKEEEEKEVSFSF